MTGSAGRLPRETFFEVLRNAPLVSIDLITRDGRGRVLVGFRKNEPAAGTWFVPGGCVRKNERLADAFERISEEELGVAVKREASRFLGVYEHFYDANFAGVSGVSTHYVVLAHEISFPADSAPLPEAQHEEYLWLSPGELLEHPGVHENTRAYFRKTPGPAEREV